MGCFRKLTESYIQIALQQFSRYWFGVLLKDTLAGEAADENICRRYWTDDLFSYGTVSYPLGHHAFSASAMATVLLATTNVHTFNISTSALAFNERTCLCWPYRSYSRSSNAKIKYQVAYFRFQHFSDISACVLYVLYLLSDWKPSFGAVVYLTFFFFFISECYTMQHTSCG